MSASSQGVFFFLDIDSRISLEKETMSHHQDLIFLAVAQSLLHDFLSLLHFHYQKEMEEEIVTEREERDGGRFVFHFL